MNGPIRERIIQNLAWAILAQHTRTVDRNESMMQVFQWKQRQHFIWSCAQLWYGTRHVNNLVAFLGPGSSHLFQKTLLQCIAAPLLCRLRLGYLCVEPGMHFSGAQWLQCEFHIVIRCYKLYKERTLMCLETWCHDPWSIYDPYLQFLVIQLLLFTCGSFGFTQRCFSSCRQPLRRLPNS